MDNKYNRHNRRKYSLKVHIVLVTKYRKQLIKKILSLMMLTILLAYYGTNMVRFCLNSIGIFWSDGYFLQHWRSIVNYHTKIY